MSVSNFSWVIPNKAAGCAIPDFSPGRDDAAWLAKQGVCVLVSLTMPEGADAAQKECARYGIDWIYYPIRDFSTPEDSVSFAKLMDVIVSAMKNDRGVCVHCYAGVGRTGLVLACALGKYLALPYEQTVAALRKARTAIETPVQEDFIREFLENG